MKVCEDDIQVLRSEAAEHGDTGQVELCDRALAGDEVAWCACEDALRAPTRRARGADARPPTNDDILAAVLREAVVESVLGAFLSQGIARARVEAAVDAAVLLEAAGRAAMQDVPTAQPIGFGAGDEIVAAVLCAFHEPKRRRILRAPVVEAVLRAFLPQLVERARVEAAVDGGAVRGGPRDRR